MEQAPIAQGPVDVNVSRRKCPPAYVRPRRETLDGKGHFWELILAERGWNELSDDDKNGRIVAVYADGTIGIHFDALDYTCCGVFPDEVSWVGHKATDVATPNVKSMAFSPCILESSHPSLPALQLKKTS